MEMFIALLFPLIAAAGFNQILEVIQIIWTTNRIEARLLERRFERHLRTLWSWRWRIAIGSGFWLFVCGTIFVAGLWGEIPPMVTLSGLAVTLYVWFVGLAIKAIVSIYYRIYRHNQESLSVLPGDVIPWLEGLGLLARPFRALGTERGAEAKLITKIELIYYYIMMIVMSFTFWLGLFPTGRIWAALLVIFSGSALLAVLAHLIGDKTENKKKTGLRFLKALTALWLLLAIKFALSAALFPNIALAWKNKIKPLFEDRVSNFLVDLVSPAKAVPLPPKDDSKKLVVETLPDLNKTLAGLSVTGGNKPASPSINTGNTTNITNNAAPEPSKKHSDHLTMDADALEVCQKFPDLEKCPEVLRVLGPAAAMPAMTSPVTPTTNGVEPPPFVPTVTPPASETLSPFGLPPVKQLP